MYVHPQGVLPGSAPMPVHCHLRFTVTPEGPASLHWHIEGIPSGPTIALGAVLRQSRQDLELVAPQVLTELLRVSATLADPPPFE